MCDCTRRDVNNLTWEQTVLLAREALDDWRAGKLTEFAALVALSLVLYDQRDIHAVTDKAVSEDWTFAENGRE